MKRLRQKLAIVSNTLPPSTDGTGMRLYRLLRDIDPDDYCLLTYSDRRSVDALPGTPGRLPATHYRLRREWRLFLPSIILKLPLFFRLGVVNLLIRVYQRAKDIARIVRQERCGTIMAFSGDLINLPAGFLASLWCRTPFCAVVDDDYSYQWTERVSRCFAGYIEPVILKGAARVVVINDFIKDEYRRRYGIDPAVIYNPCELTATKRADVRWPATEDEISIVYTGSVYHAHYDAFENLLVAIKLLGRTDVKLHIYSGQSRECLEQKGIRGPVVFHGHLPPSKIPEVQGQADILFLPLAFKSAIPEVIRTSAPFKMGEYLASGRPVLVHAPEDSFLSWYFRKHQCGMVVDRNDPVILAKEIERLISDHKLRRNLSLKAREIAERDFSIDAMQEKFRELLDGCASS